MPYEILNSEQFWVLVAFLIFVGLIFNPVRKILTKNLDEKILEIKNSIDEAEKLKKEAQISLGEVKKRQNDVKKEIEVIQKEVKEKILFYEEQSKINLKQQLELMKMCGKVNNNPTIARNPNFALLVSKCSGIIIPENKKPEGSHWDDLKDNYKKENPNIKLMGDKFIGPKQ